MRLGPAAVFVVLLMLGAPAFKLGDPLPDRWFAGRIGDDVHDEHSPPDLAAE